MPLVSPSLSDRSRAKSPAFLNDDTSRFKMNPPERSLALLMILFLLLFISNLQWNRLRRSNKVASYQKYSSCETSLCFQRSWEHILRKAFEGSGLRQWIIHSIIIRLSGPIHCVLPHADLFRSGSPKNHRFEDHLSTRSDKLDNVKSRSLDPAAMLELTLFCSCRSLL